MIINNVFGYIAKSGAKGKVFIWNFKHGFENKNYGDEKDKSLYLIILKTKMEAEAIKVDLIDKIEHADVNQLQEIYGLITNYFNGEETDDNWDSLSSLQQERLTKSIEQADAGMGVTAAEAIKQAKEKYGL